MSEPVKYLRGLFLPPNLLSLSRILLLPAVVYLLDYRSDLEAALLAFLLLLMILSDYGDGILARRRGEITELGKILDPLADKIVVNVVAFALVAVKGFPLWVALLLLFRDFAILAGGIWAVRRRGVVGASNLPGKIAVNVFGLLLISFIFEIEPARKPLIVATVGFVLLSGFAYARRLFSGR